MTSAGFSHEVLYQLYVHKLNFRLCKVGCSMVIDSYVYLYMVYVYGARSLPTSYST